MGFVRRLGILSPVTFPSPSSRFRPAQRCSIGRFRRSGTSGRIGSPNAAERVVDFRALNLHVRQLQRTGATRMLPRELRPRLHSLPHQPASVPYRTSYWSETWGFCAQSRGTLDGDSQRRVRRVHRLDARPRRTHLRRVPCSRARTADEILISAHMCHPSLCDDNLTGLRIFVPLARAYAELRPPPIALRFV